MPDIRVGTLEQDLNSLKTDVAIIRSHYASKDDVSNARNSIIVWVVGSIFLAQILPSLLSFLKIIH